MLLVNLLLAAAWIAVTGEMTLTNVLVGVVAGYGILRLTLQPAESSRYFTRAPQVLLLASHFAWELVVASLRVALDVVTPRHWMRPAVLAVPIEARSAAEATVLANAITLTPGTLTLEVSPDNKTLYVHAMYASDVEAARRTIQEGLGRRVREVFE